jgi:pectate lyase
MKVGKLLALVAILGMVGFAMAQDEPKKKRTPGVFGKIVKIEDKNIVVASRTRGSEETKEVTVVTDDKTVVTLDEKEAKLADLKADMFVRITPATGTAEKVNAFTKMPERKRKPKEDAPKE